jgi:hypothetical protein
MGFKHLLHNRRAVRLGGFRLWRFHLGGGVYTVGPMSTLRFVQYIEAAGKLGMLLGESMPRDDPSAGAALYLFRVLVPLIIAEPIHPAHLEHASAMQILAAFEAWQEVNDLPYMLKSVQGSGDGKGHGFDRFVVSLARMMHLRVHEVLEQPYQEVLATVEALNAEEFDLPAGAEPLSEDERRKLGNLAHQVGFEVN